MSSFRLHGYILPPFSVFSMGSWNVATFQTTLTPLLLSIFTAPKGYFVHGHRITKGQQRYKREGNDSRGRGDKAKMREGMFGIIMNPHGPPSIQSGRDRQVLIASLKSRCLFIYYSQQMCTLVPDSFSLKQDLKPIIFLLASLNMGSRNGRGHLGWWIWHYDQTTCAK